MIFNEIDSSLLVSTIWEGARGHWLRHPPYVTETNAGAFIYPQYILLGHIAAWLALEPIIIFHLARLGGGVVLLITLYQFSSRYFADIAARRFAWLLLVTGSGLGWLALLFGHTTTPDLTQPEAYPFFSLFSNLHFTWAMTALVWLLDVIVAPGVRPHQKALWVKLIVGALILATAQPFGLIVVGIVTVLWIITRGIREQQMPLDTIRQLCVMGLLSAPFILHQQWTITNNPAYIGWRQQVETLSPPVWDFGIGIGLLLPFTLHGVWLAAQRRRADDFLLLYWVLAVALLVYLPYYQNRRFEFGAYVVCALLAARSLSQLRPLRSWLRRLGFVALNALTNIIVIAAVFWLLGQHHATLFMERSEWQAIQYLRQRAAERSVVLASPQLSLFIIASSDLRVIYAHPWETPHATETLTALTAFYRGDLNDSGSLLASVDYILVGPREKEWGAPTIPSEFAPIFTSSDMTIYARTAR